MSTNPQSPSSSGTQAPSENAPKPGDSTKVDPVPLPKAPPGRSRKDGEDAPRR